MVDDLITRTLDATSRVLGALTPDKWLFIAFALLPALAWMYIFLARQRENRGLVAMTFIAGIVAVIPVFALQIEIERIHTFLGGWSTPLIAVLLTSLWIGLYEETAKHWVVQKVDDSTFRNVDDAIELSIVAALGFSFIENVMYFHSIWNNPAIDNFWFYYTFRSLGSMFLHVFASGIYGYFYGLAHFAQPVLQDHINAGYRFPIVRTLHHIFHLKSSTLFHEEMVVVGLIAAATIHGAFDAMMGLSDYFQNEGNIFLYKFFLIAAVPFLVGGYFWLTALLDKKEDHKAYGHVIDDQRTSPTEAA